MTTATKPFSADELRHFTGTENYYRHGLTPAKMTDGVFYLAERAGAHWLVDEICLANALPKIRREEFQVWKLSVSDSVGMLSLDDGDGNIIYTKRIAFTDFPLPEIKLYFVNSVLLLPSEY